MDFILLFLTVTLLLLLWHKKSSREESFDEPPTIAVSIASYRDEECSSTVRQLFEKAKYPENITCFIFQQNLQGADGEHCMNDPSFRWKKQVHIETIPHTEAGGPTVARSKICDTFLRRGAREAYYLQLDSHEIPAEHWDLLCLQDIKRAARQAGHGTVALSAYPNSHENTAKGTPVICKVKFNREGVPSLEAAIKPYKNDGTLYLTPFAAGGFFFCPREVMKKVPFASFDALFVGEEILHSARLFCAGVDLFAPSKDAFTHHYTRSKAPKVWQDQGDFKKRQQKSVEEIKLLLGLRKPRTIDEKRWNVTQQERLGLLGGKRTLDDYWAFSRNTF